MGSEAGLILGGNQTASGEIKLSREAFWQAALSSVGLPGREMVRLRKAVNQTLALERRWVRVAPPEAASVKAWVVAAPTRLCGRCGLWGPKHRTFEDRSACVKRWRKRRAGKARYRLLTAEERIIWRSQAPRVEKCRLRRMKFFTELVPRLAAKMGQEWVRARCEEWGRRGGWVRFRKQILRHFGGVGRPPKRPWAGEISRRTHRTNEGRGYRPPQA